MSARVLLLVLPGLLLSLAGCQEPSLDADGDGVLATHDCDDHDAAVTRGPVWYPDRDHDGYGVFGAGEEACEAPGGYSAEGGDCDDQDPAISPVGSEVCNGRDDDCDGLVDDDAADAPAWYADADADGYGDPSVPTRACTPPPGLVADSADCDDADATVSPAAVEVCDGRDDDCDGEVDEDDAVDGLTWYADADADGYGDAESPSFACGAPDGTVADDTDCDDADPTAHPGGTEVCGGGDEDCDGWVDDDDALATAPTWYVDVDGDGYGNANVPWIACDAPTGFVADDTDCDDTESAAFPGGIEVCDDADDDCDGTVDEDALDAPAWYPDADEDGYGDPSAGVLACDAPADFIADGTDCDDADDTINPGAAEYCRTGDEDCDGVEADDDPDVVDPTAWYLDLDGDGDGDPATEVYLCVLDGALDRGRDCDDTDPAIRSEVADPCGDGVDQDCLGGDQSCAVEGDWGLASSDVILQGGTDSQFGAAVSSAGDIDGDGLDDLLVGDPADSTVGSGAGVGWLVLSPATGTVDVATEGTAMWGIDADDAAGTGIAGLGDLDGDGLGEVLVGGPGRAPNQAGAAWLVSGATLLGGSLSLSSADADFPGQNEWDYTGDTVSPAGDLDGDGLGDFVLGCTRDITAGVHAGSVVVAYGQAYSGSQDLSTFARVLGAQGGDHVGGGVDGAGDVDGDGLDDIVFGAEDAHGGGAHSGRAYVVLGPVTGVTSADDAEAVWLGEDALDEAGSSVAGLGDVDGDGYRDLAVGAPGNARGGYEAGTVYVLRGPFAAGEDTLANADALLTGTAAATAGASVAGPGDVDGDGYDDVLVGEPGDASLGFAAGAAYVVYGPVSGEVALEDADAHLVGTGGAGEAVAGAGDTDGDGLPDLLVGGPRFEDGGRVWLVLGVSR